MSGNSNSGRPTAREEALKILSMGLANRLHNERLELIENKPVTERTDQELKDFVLPVSIKGIIEKSENTLILPKPLLGGQAINGLPNNNSSNEAIKTEEENKSNPGGN